jgi:hypothetical protein
MERSEHCGHKDIGTHYKRKLYHYLLLFYIIVASKVPHIMYHSPDLKNRMNILLCNFNVVLQTS